MSGRVSALMCFVHENKYAMLSKEHKNCEKEYYFSTNLFMYHSFRQKGDSCLNCESLLFICVLHFINYRFSK